MVSLVLLELALVFFALLDSKHTLRKVAEYGIVVELNPGIRWLSRYWGPAWGIPLGIFIPTGFWCIFGYYYPLALAFIVGTRFTLFLFQQQGKN